MSYLVAGSHRVNNNDWYPAVYAAGFQEKTLIYGCFSHCWFCRFSNFDNGYQQPLSLILFNRQISLMADLHFWPGCLLF